MCFRPAAIGMVVCPKCGANNLETAETCTECGVPLSKDGSTTAAAPGVPAPGVPAPGVPAPGVKPDGSAESK